MNRLGRAAGWPGRRLAALWLALTENARDAVAGVGLGLLALGASRVFGWAWAAMVVGVILLVVVAATMMTGGTRNGPNRPTDIPE